MNYGKEKPNTLQIMDKFNKALDEIYPSFD